MKQVDALESIVSWPLLLIILQRHGHQADSFPKFSPRLDYHPVQLHVLEYGDNCCDFIISSTLDCFVLTKKIMLILMVDVL